MTMKAEMLADWLCRTADKSNDGETARRLRDKATELEALATKPAKE